MTEAVGERGSARLGLSVRAAQSGEVLGRSDCSCCRNKDLLSPPAASDAAHLPLDKIESLVSHAGQEEWGV